MDIYERALTRSRTVRKRNMMIASGAAAVAVVGLAAGVAAGRPSERPPAVTPPTAAPAPEPSVTSPSARASGTPTAPSTSRPSGKPRTSGTSAGGPCPVGAATLQRVTDLPDGYRLTDVECWHDWASAGLIAPDPDLQGDGLVLFRYAAGKGWREYAEGSAWDCADLGIRKTPGDLPPFCSFG